MAPWVAYAFVSMFFAGVTSVIAKKGLADISGDLGVVVRTGFVFVFTAIFALVAISKNDWSLMKLPNWLWLGASALTTTLSWIFYYRAIKLGEVSSVALIDKGSVVVAVLLACFFLHESLSVAKIAGAACIVLGLIVIARG